MDDITKLVCANCDTSFETGEDQVTKFHVTIAETPYHQKDVSILEALATVCRAKSSKLGGYDKMIMCTRCATVVAELYRSFVELMQLSKSTAYVAKVLMQAEIWHKTRQAAMSSASDPNKDAEENECSQDYLTSVLAIELTEAGPDEDSGLSDQEEGSKEIPEEEESEKNSKSDSDLRRIVPKKRKMTDSLQTSDSSMNSRNRRKNTKPLKLSSTDTVLSPGGSEEGQAKESGLRRSDRRRAASLSKKSEVKEDDEDENGDDISDESFTDEPDPVQKKRKKGSGRFQKPKAKAKGRIKKRKPRTTVSPNEEEEEEDEGETHSNRPVLKIPCSFCDKVFHYYWMLDQHVQLIHEDKTPRSCDVCGFKYFNFRMFEIHYCIPKESQAEERLERPFRCKFCGKTQVTKGNFAAHCGSHDVDEDKRYKCPYPDCKLTFKFPKNLVKHEKSHLEEKSWQCSICGKVFRVKRNLTIHMEIHKEEKKYLCPTCGERFAQRRGLFRHLNTHGSNLKHKCPICGKGFKRKDHVTQHLKSKVHPNFNLDGSQNRSVEDVLPLIIFDAPVGDTLVIQKEENLEENSTLSTENSQPNQVLPTLNQSHTFISNPSVVLNQHPTEFAFSDLLTL